MLDMNQVNQIRIFISHSSKDRRLARCLVRAIETGVRIKSSEIRCTSVKGYRLPFGVHTAEQLKQEISQAEAVIGIVTPQSLKSSYVLFELGAAWGLRKTTFPLLAKGARVKDLPGPLHEYNAARLTKRNEVMQTLKDLCGRTRLESDNDDPALVEVAVKKVIKHAKD